MTYTSLGNIDWTAWQPAQRATLLYVISDGQILLIRKKRGLGAGRDRVLLVGDGEDGEDEDRRHPYLRDEGARGAEETALSGVF